MAVIVTALVVFAMRKTGMVVVYIDMGWVEFQYILFESNWPYIVLSLVEIGHLVLTVWGSIEFFDDFHKLFNCYMEIPLFSNATFMLLLFGYLVTLRGLVIIIHFRFGPSILRWLYRACPCFRRFEQHVVKKEKFPQYTH